MEAYHDQHIYYLGNRVEPSFSREKKDEIDGGARTSTSHVSRCEPVYFRENRRNLVCHASGRNDLREREKIHGPEPIDAGDELFWNFLTVTLKDDDLLQVTAYEPSNTLEKNSSTKHRNKKNKKKMESLYRRTPCLIYDLPDDQVSFSFPSQESENNSRGLWLVVLPPLVMLLVMGIVALSSRAESLLSCRWRCLS
ncbi:hypothetical protein ACEQPO_24000 [Bacillus sp. SL00103]